MKLEYFNSNYIYQTDKEKFGFLEVWDIPKPQNDGKYYGDCEDYVIFLKHNIDQFEEWNYYSCLLDGIGHCVLIKNEKIIDCNCKKVMTIIDYKNIYNVSNFKKYGVFTVFSKFVVGKIVKFFKGVE